MAAPDTRRTSNNENEPSDGVSNRLRNGMSHFLGSPPAGLRPAPDQARTLEMLATLFVVALVVTALYAGREIFIPIAIALLVSLVLSPPVLLLRGWGLGRVPSVLIVVLAALAIALLAGAVLTRQVSELATDLPKYQATVNAKIFNLRDAIADDVHFSRLSAALQHIREINKPRPPASSAPAPSDQPRNQLTEDQETKRTVPAEVRKPPPARSKAPAAPKNPGEINSHRPAPLSAPADQPKNQLSEDQESQRPVPVEVDEAAWGPLAIAQTIAGTALSSLETFFIVVIYVIFVLLQREDLRDRFIRLAGSSDLHRTTLAMNDAAGRLSRFCLIQTLVNASFGIIVAVGLYFIGIPSSALWGIAAFLLRFVPFVGPFIAASFPLAMAVAIDPGWGMALETLALFLFVETIIAQAVEPWLYGQSMGISPVAVVVSATFWWWMWGTVGLLMSTPLTVCLVVLGRHVERLAFLDVIFGNAPPLTPIENFYQRMLAGDASEVVDQAEQFLKTNSLIDYYDEVALQALLMAQVDLGRGVLDEIRQRRIKETIEEVIDDLSDHDEPLLLLQAPPGNAEPDSPQSETVSAELAPHDDMGRTGVAPRREHQKPVLCIAGRGLLDEAAAALLAQILVRYGIEAKVEPARPPGNGQIPRFSSDDGERMVYLSYLGADLSPAGARLAVRRLRRRLGDVKIAGGFWQSGAGQASELCAATKADFCATNFKDAVALCLREAATEAKAEAGAAGAEPAAKSFAAAAEG